jgi:RHS repeat-associated protein
VTGARERPGEHRSQLVNEYRYTPFGTPVNRHPMQGTPNPLQYIARELDGLSGRYCVRKRWYDPPQGRFISEDRIGLAGGLNQYLYADGNPVKARDPSGLRTCWFYVTTWDAPVYADNGRIQRYETYVTWELMYCETEETRKGTERRRSQCSALDPYVCERFRYGAELLRQHPSDICREMGARAEQRMLQGGWLYNPNLPYNG